MYDPDDWSMPNCIEMPAKIIALENIDGEAWAVLEGGATVRISDMFKDHTPDSLQ